MILQITYYLLSILGIIKKQSKPLTIMMMVVMWIVFGLCTYNGDYDNYNWIYQNVQNPDYWVEFEPLFILMMYVCSIMDLSFIQFRMIFGVLYIILLYVAIGKYTQNKAEALGLYMLFPFLWFTSVVRSGFAGVLIVLAYFEIIAEHGNKIKFWLLVSLATLMHYTSIFFIVFYFLRKKAFKRHIIYLVIGLLVIAFVTYYTGLLYHLISILITSERFLRWFILEHVGQEPRWVLYLMIIALMIVFLSNLSYKDNNMRAKEGLDNNPFAEDIFYINIAMLLFIPTFFVTNASARLMWEILLFNIICYAKDDEIKFPKTTLKYVYFSRKTIILIVFLMSFAFYANFPYRGTENDTRLVFQNNLIYGEYTPRQ